MIFGICNLEFNTFVTRLKIENKKILKESGLEPIKHAGQNFLVSEEMIEKIISEAKIKKGEIILEIGPGTGNLTEALLSAGADVMAVEKDQHLAELLNSKLQNPNDKSRLYRGSSTESGQIPNSKLQIINSDILKFDETKIKKPYRIIANIPYYLTGHLIQKFLISKNKPAEMIIMVQKEVGERISAKPPKMNFLSSLVQYLAEAEILFPVKKENFWPQPKVDSVMIKIIPRASITSLRSYARETFGIKNNKNKEFIEFLKIVFKQPRQTLFNNLRRGGVKNSEEIIDQLDLPKNVRGQCLNLESLLKIFAYLNNAKLPNQNDKSITND